MVSLRSWTKYGAIWTPGTSMTTGSDGSPGSEGPASLMAITRKRYMIPYLKLDPLMFVQGRDWEQHSPHDDQLFWAALNLIENNSTSGTQPKFISWSWRNHETWQVWNLAAHCYSLRISGTSRTCKFQGITRRRLWTGKVIKKAELKSTRVSANQALNLFWPIRGRFTPCCKAKHSFSSKEVVLHLAEGPSQGWTFEK